jgi:hypothetical protein
MSKPSEPVVTVRFIKEPDLSAVVECERASHEYADPDFGTPALPAYAWGMGDLVAGIGQYKSKLKRQNDTRTQVAEVQRKVTRNGLTSTENWVCGAQVYELGEDGYNVILFTAHPAAPPEVRVRMLGELLGRAERSEKRKKVTLRVPDGDYRTVRFLQERGAKISLQPSKVSSALGGNDEWVCEFEAGRPRKAVRPSMA